MIGIANIIIDIKFNSVVAKSLIIFMFSTACLPEKMLSGIMLILTAKKQITSRIDIPAMIFPKTFKTILCLWDRYIIYSAKKKAMNGYIGKR